MAIAAHFDQAAAAPRGARRVLRLDTYGETAAGDAAAVRVHNLSATGLLLETEVELGAGETLAVALPLVGEIEASVVWRSERFYGCQLAAPLSPAALDAAQQNSERAESRPARGEPDEGFAMRLQRLRKARGLTLSQIALALEVSKPTVWAWEQGRARPVESRVAALASVLGVTGDELFPAAGSGPELGDILTQARERIAAAAGTRPDRIRILVEL
jgi:transcriptional regulator with XRE-family HTH domain